jgi:hypothetical protein
MAGILYQFFQKCEITRASKNGDDLEYGTCQNNTLTWDLVTFGYHFSHKVSC